jgi:hypothetical protein
MATLNAMVGIVAQQYTEHSKFGRWRRAVTMALDPGGVFSGGLVNLALACGGEVQLSSPLGQWMLKLSRNIEGGASLNSSALSPVHSQIGQGPFFQWAQRITLDS